jgi:hypothetical protein
LKDKDFARLIELTHVKGGLIPTNQNAIELLDRTGNGEVLYFLEVTNRDVSFHRCYFALLSFIYDYLPNDFKKKITKDKFYIFVKHLAGEYKIVHTFKDGTSQIEYNSIAFGKMSQKDFEAYVANQLPFIYANVLGAYFEMDILNGIIETIETEFKKLISKLP